MPDDIRYGPDNPHPLSTLRTELVWEGKYDEYGNRREVDVAFCAMPLQKIETVDEPRQRAEGQRQLFEPEKAHRDDFRNMLIWGDNKLVMASLLKDFKGKIDLIYIDPPFDVGADFTMEIPLGDEKEEVEKDQSTLEMVAYRDMWGRGSDSYLQMMSERLMLMKELLSESGSIFIHLDYRVGHHVKILLDELFGLGNFHNEIAREKSNPKNYTRTGFGNVHDTIFFYSKGPSFKWTKPYLQRDEAKIVQDFPEVDKDGRRYKTAPLHAPGVRYGESGQPWRGLTPPEGNHWRYVHRTLDELDADERIHWSTTGNPREIIYADESSGMFVQDIWLGYKDTKGDFPSAKNPGLCELMVNACTEEGDLVADFFCGSGTMGVVAENLGRRWIMCDLGRFAIHTSRKRLIGLQRQLHAEGKPYRSFDVYNLGRYERQWWQKAHLNGADGEHRRVVLEFYRAEPLKDSPSPLLHGRKSQTWVHVDNIDSILTRDEVTNVALAAKEAGARDVACLSWEFEMDLRLTCNRLEQELGVKIKLIQIPREIMEKNRTLPPPFLEVATLEAEPVIREVSGKRVADIKLKAFLPSLAEVPTRELEALRERAVNSGFDFIDFWAVDFDYAHGRPFNHDWQAYRTRKNRSLPSVSDVGYEYGSKGPHTACVKVVDVFGCDTSITVEVPI